jgi:hypothetical protein
MSQQEQFPTRAVHDKLAFIQKRSSCTIREQAPAAVRAALPQVSPGCYRPPTLPPATPPKKSSFPRPSNVTLTMTPEDPKKKSTTHAAAAAHLASTDDTVTTHSQMTKSLSSTQNRFYELESSIRRQQTASQIMMTNFKKSLNAPSPPLISVN